MKEIGVPKELVGLEFRVLDNMPLERVFMVYHFCLLGMEMVRGLNKELPIAPRNQGWHNVMYNLVKNGVDTKIVGSDKKVFEGVFGIKLGNNFRDWFWDYFSYLYDRYNSKSIILRK